MKLKFIIVLLFVYTHNIHAQEDKKTTVGILPVTSSQNQYQRYADQVYSYLSQAFGGKTRFIIVDRGNFDKITQERELQKREEFIDGLMVEQGKSLGAQFLITSKITRMNSKSYYETFSRMKKDERTGQFYTEKFQGPVVYADIEVNIQITDVSTGQIKSSQNVFASFKFENQPSKTEADAINVAIGKLESEFRKWVNNQFPVLLKVLKIEQTNNKGMPKTILITGGYNMDIRKGTILKVYFGEYIESDGKRYYSSTTLGEVVAYEIKGDLSVCKVKKGKEAILQRFNEGKPEYLTITRY